MTYKVWGPMSPKPSTGVIVDTTSAGEFRAFSPFFLEPIGGQARNVENLWQYSKVYPEYADSDGNPLSSFFTWREAGFAKHHAERYPLGKGRKPLYSFWQGERLGYVQARERIYEPQYRSAVLAHATDHLERVKQLHAMHGDVWLFDFDGYDYHAYDMTLADVGRNEERPMGHAFVLASILSGEIIF